MDNFSNDIALKGVFNLKVIDSLTGKLLDEILENNVILDTGLDLVRRSFSMLNSPVVSYLQLGNDPTQPTVTDVSKLSTGELSEAPSEVLPVVSLYLKPNTVLFKCVVNSNQANRTNGANYQEAVLMARASDTSPYIWFARKKFDSKFKNTNLVFEINWEVSFIYRTV